MSKKASGGPPRRRIGVFVVDDHEIVRRGVRDLLEAEPDIEVVGEASTASSALAQIPALRPSVAVLDVRLPDGDGVAVCREVRSRVPEVACLMFSAFSEDEALLDSIMAGAAGYVLKQVRGSDLVGAVRTVASGQSLLDSRAASKAMARLRDEANGHDRLAGLSARERKVLDSSPSRPCSATNATSGRALVNSATRSGPTSIGRTSWPRRSRASCTRAPERSET